MPSARTSSASTSRCRPSSSRYNPEGFTIVTEGNWKDSPQPATNGSQPQWQGVAPPKMDVKILLDAFAVPPLPPSLVIDQLKMLVLPTVLSMGVGASTAPTVMFGWGPNIIMDQAIVDQGLGRLRALPSRRAGPGHGHRDPCRPSPSRPRSAPPTPPPVVWPPGAPTPSWKATRWPRSPHEEYRDPNKWRALAEANNIDDPMRVKPGTVLIVPDRREAEALS